MTCIPNAMQSKASVSDSQIRRKTQMPLSLHNSSAKMEDDTPESILNQSFFYSLLRAHEECHGYASDTLAHFNHFLTSRLPKMIRDFCACTVVVNNGAGRTRRHVVSFSNVTLEKPTVPKTDGAARGLRVMQTAGDILFPHEALLRGLTYTAGVFVDVKHEIFETDGGPETLLETTDYRNIYFFSMPIPVKCLACNLSDPELAASPLAHADPEDEGGYWIVRGMVKVIQPQKVQVCKPHDFLMFVAYALLPFDTTIFARSLFISPAKQHLGHPPRDQGS